MVLLVALLSLGVEGNPYEVLGYCMGMCDYSMDSDALAKVSKIVCEQNDDGSNDCSNVHSDYSATWMSGGSIYKKRVLAYVTTDANGWGNTAGAVISYSCPSSVDCDTVLSVYDKDISAVTLLAGALNASTTYAICPKPKTDLCDQPNATAVPSPPPKSLVLNDYESSATRYFTPSTLVVGILVCFFTIIL
jgi:hypothetical protein